MAGALEPIVKARLGEICAERKAVVRFLDDEVSLLSGRQQAGFDVFGAEDIYTDLRLGVLGRYQRSNAAVAVGALELFLGQALEIDSLRRGLKETVVPGRLEVLSEQPLCILDGAHNPSGMAEMVKSLDHILDRRRLIGVVSILRDKGAVEMLNDLAPRCDILFVTQNSNPAPTRPKSSPGCWRT